MHSLFLKSKAALHSRLKLSGLCPHTSWSKLLCNGNCEQRIVCIIFKSSTKKKTFTNTCHTAIVKYWYAIWSEYAFFICVRETIYLLRNLKWEKTEHREKGLKGLECVENMHSNMEDLESSICQFVKCACLHYGNTLLWGDCLITTESSCCCKQYSDEMNKSTFIIKGLNYCWISRISTFIVYISHTMNAVMALPLQSTV